MENRESKTESAERKFGQRSQELGDQQRIDQKARALTAEQDRSGSSNTGGIGGGRIELQSGRGASAERVLNGDEAAALCENMAFKRKWIEQNPYAPAMQLEKMRKDVSDGEAQIQRTPLGNCPTE